VIKSCPAIAIERALAHASQMTVVNRSIDLGRELDRLIQARTDASALFVHWEDKYRVLDDPGLLANARSVGLFPNV
jgi:shikimate dehydrogenase